MKTERRKQQSAPVYVLTRERRITLYGLKDPASVEDPADEDLKTLKNFSFRDRSSQPRILCIHFQLPDEGCMDSEN